MKSELDGEEYDRLSDYAMSETDSDVEDDRKRITPLTTPSTLQNKRPSDVKKHACPYDGCSKTFNRQARLNEHLRSHTNTRPFKCPRCPKDFLRDSHLKHHVKSAHSEVRDYLCSHSGCGKSFATGTRLRRHEATHSGEDKYRCSDYADCNQTFRKKETLNRHILQAHQQAKPFQCTEVDATTGDDCKKTFDTADKLKSHQRSMHDPTKFSCTICVQAQTMAYRDPTNIKDEALAYFSTYAALKRHVDSAHPPTCAHCSLLFKTMKELSRHVELVHDIVDPNSLPREEPHKCSYADCDRSFSKKGNLSVHVRTVHEKRRDFVCGQTEVCLPEIPGDVELVGCGRDFTSKSTLEEHIRTAHLGMQAKRVERNRKRQAEKQEADDENGSVPKKRRTRKDKGVKKMSAIQSLVDGFPVYQHGSIAQADDYDSDEGDESDVYSVCDEDKDDGLTGSMVMHGNLIFHGEKTFHFDSGGSSLSTDTPSDSIYQQVNHSGVPTAEQLPNFDLSHLNFEHGFGFTDDHYLGLPSTITPLDLHQEANMTQQQPTHLGMTDEEWFHLQQQVPGDMQRAPGGVPVDPLLFA